MIDIKPIAYYTDEIYVKYKLLIKMNPSNKNITCLKTLVKKYNMLPKEISVIEGAVVLDYLAEYEFYSIYTKLVNDLNKLI